jgi:hypothetical protein
MDSPRPILSLVSWAFPSLASFRASSCVSPKLGKAKGGESKIDMISLPSSNRISQPLEDETDMAYPWNDGSGKSWFFNIWRRARVHATTHC